MEGTPNKPARRRGPLPHLSLQPTIELSGMFEGMTPSELLIACRKAGVLVRIDDGTLWYEFDRDALPEHVEVNVPRLEQLLRIAAPGLRLLLLHEADEGSYAGFDEVVWSH